MSRFFANVDEEEEEVEQPELEEIKEEEDEAKDDKTKAKNKNKKKKKGKADETEVKEVVEVQEEPDDGKKDAGKKKKGKPTKGVSAIQKKIEEKRKADQEMREKHREAFFNFTVDYRRILFDDIKDFSAQHNKRILNKKKKQELKDKGLAVTKKDKERLERAEAARLQFSQMNQVFESQVSTTTSAPIKKKKKKLKAKEEANREQQEAQDEEKNEQNAKEAEAEQIKQDGAELDDWENLIDDDVKAETEPQPKQTKTEAKPQELQHKKQETKPVEQIAKEPVDVDIEKLRDVKNFTNPLDFFNLKSKYRCPIICIMGHVDTGKTKILDHIRNTNVQGGEAGGITQQIGASFFPAYKLKEEIAKLDRTVLPVDVDMPGFLIIDTPGHESFANLRSRGSSLCDFAIVVIDIMHSLENQTIESLKMLIERKTPFVIALNKIDRLFKWIPSPDQSSYKSLNNQEGFVRMQFDEKLLPVRSGLGALEVNAELYWKNEDPLEYTSIVPTSAITGEGIPDLLGYIAYYTQKFQHDQILKNLVDFKATVLEVKKIEGMGATIDIILVNGILEENDKIVMSGFNGPLATTIKALLTPHPMKEMRVKNEYLHHKRIEGAIGVKIMATGLEQALAGSSVYKYKTDEELEEYSNMLNEDIKKIKKKVKLSKEGVGVAASTLGSLEALLDFLKASKIPVSTVCIGDVSKNDLMRILTPFVHDDNKCKKREYLTLLAFDVKLLPDAIKFAEDYNIKVITAKIIYHLFDGFKKHVDFIQDERKKEEGKKAVFPCVLKQVEVFNKKDPIIIGVDVVRGVLKIGTPVCVPTKGNLKIGIVEGIQANHKAIKEATRKTGSVAIRIKADNSILHGRHFEQADDLVSMLTRESIDALKLYFRDEMGKDDWELVRLLKSTFGIP